MEKNNEFISLFTPSGCLTEEAMKAYALDDLPDFQKLQLKEHLGSCEFCSVASEGIELFIQEKGAEAYTKAIDNLSDRLDIKLSSIPETNPEKKVSRRTSTLMTLVSIAASILMLIGLYFVIQLWMPETQQLAVEKQAPPVSDSLIFASPPPPPSSETNVPYEKTPAPREQIKKTITAERTMPNGNLAAEQSQTLQPAPSVDAIPDQVIKNPAVSAASPGALQNTYSPVQDTVVVSEISISEDKVSNQETASDRLYTVSTTASGKKGKAIREPAPPESPESNVFTIVEEMPVYPGGEEARLKFLHENISYPLAALENGISGDVYVTFVIDSNGRIKDVRVKKGIGGGCDEEAVRVIKKMPRWIPGRQAGKPVNVQLTMPVRFTGN